MFGCERAVPPTGILQRLSDVGRPHIVLIVVDTLRADLTSAYGYERETSPELEAWASRGVLFENVRSQSSWTKMSMASMLTSLWPTSHGIRKSGDGLGDSAVTLAELLQAAGYDTYAVQTNGWLHQSFGFHQGFERYRFPKGEVHPGLRAASVWAHADRVVDEASRLIDAHEPSRPLFLYLHFMDVHEYAAPPSFKDFGTDDLGAYLAAIRWVDSAVERVRKKLHAAGYLDHTVMVLTSDHGETFGEHGVHGHARNVLTPVVSVPLVFRFPFRVQPLRVATQVRGVDLAPTLLALAGVPIPARFEGASLVPLMTGSLEENRTSYADLGEPLFPDASVQSAVTDGEWTYARNAPPREGDSQGPEARGVAPGAEFLFDRRVDAAENVNLAGREPAQLRRMRALLAERATERASGVLQEGVRIDPGIAERLRSLGYLR